MPKIAVLIQPSLRQQLFTADASARLDGLGELLSFEQERRLTAEDAQAYLKEADICIGSWGLPKMDEKVLAAAPRLKLIVYCAGSVKPFVTDALWARGVRVTSGAPAIAVGVAEYVTGLAILARRNAFLLSQALHRGAGKAGQTVNEVWGSTIGVVSLGQVGRRVVEHLRPFGGRLLAYDPLAPADAVAALGAEKAELDTLLDRSDVVTLHAPNLPETRHMIGRDQLRRMKDGAVLINTARGALIDEAALIAELSAGRLFACLDVTDPEPPAADSPLRTLPNAFLTPHIAGTRTPRLGLQAVEEVERFLSGRAQLCEVTRDRLASVA